MLSRKDSRNLDASIQSLKDQIKVTRFKEEFQEYKLVIFCQWLIHLIKEIILLFYEDKSSCKDAKKLRLDEEVRPHTIKQGLVIK